MTRSVPGEPRLRWWWWATLAFGVLLSILTYLSFTWIVGWVDLGAHYYVYFEHGVLVGNADVGMFAPGSLPSYGYFEVYQSGVYDNWVLLPKVDIAVGYFKCPVHLVAIVIVPVLVYPLVLVLFRQRYRRKRGLCVKCGYNLTGNVSGICPECGERI